MLLLSTPLGFSRMFDIISRLLIAAKPKTSMLDISQEARAERLQDLSCARRNYMTGINGAFYLNEPTPVVSKDPLPRRSFFQGYMLVLDTLKYPMFMMILLLLTVCVIVVQIVFLRFSPSQWS